MHIWTILALVFLVLISLGPSIFFTVVGAERLSDKHKGSECAVPGSPQLGLWLLVEGAVGIAQVAIAVIFAAFFMLCAVYPGFLSCAPAGIMGILALIVIGLGSLFQIAWLVVGAVQIAHVHDSSKCLQKDPILYYSTIAALILGALSIIASAGSIDHKQFKALSSKP